MDVLKETEFFSNIYLNINYQITEDESTVYNIFISRAGLTNLDKTE